MVLGKTGTIRNCGNASVITFKKKRKKKCADIIVDREEWVENT